MRAPVTAGCWPTGQAEDAADAIGPSSCKHFIDNKPYRLYDVVGDREVVISLRGHLGLRQMVSHTFFQDATQTDQCHFRLGCQLPHLPFVSTFVDDAEFPGTCVIFAVLAGPKIVAS